MAQLDITSTFRWEGKNGALIATNGAVDTTGTIPISQLPDGFMDLIDFWNASTNVPYLYNSIGKKGDVYKCNFAGAVDFGTGVISFSAGDLVYYDGFIWGKIAANAASSIFAINTYSFTATAGQTVYNLTYLPNQVSVYYNGSKLTKTQYDASGGSYITLLFSPIAGDIITVDAYVNTLGLGGGGTAGSMAKWSGTSTLVNAVAGTDYVIPAALNAYVPTFRSLTINGTTYDLTADRSWSINPMVYPSAGIAVSTGSAWGTSIVDNSTNWNTAYTNRITSLTTTGSSGAATLSGNVLNIPNYGSALSSYVPYTGATADLNLGSRNLYVNNIFDGFSSITASGTQVVLTVSSVPTYYVNGSGGQTIKLPDATTLQNGAVYVFNNNQSSGAITVNNNSNTLVVSIPSGGYCTLELNNNSIAAGSWDRHFLAPSNVSWSTNTFDYAGSITSATWNGNVIAINRGGTGSSTQNFVDLTTTQTIGGAKTFSSALTASSLVKSGGTSSQYLMADGSVSTLSNPITGTGTTNTLPKFTDASTIGNSNISDSGSLVTIGTALTLSGSVTGVGNTSNYNVTASLGSAISKKITSTLVASANGDTLVGLDINPTYTVGAFTGVSQYGLRIIPRNSAQIALGGINQAGQITFARGSDGSFQGGVGYTTASTSGDFQISSGGGAGVIGFLTASTRAAQFFPTGNFTLQNGGTFTDAGFRLDVNGTTRLNGSTTITGSTTAASGIARGELNNATLVAAANSDNLIALDIAPTFTNGAFTGVNNIGLRLINTLNSTGDVDPKLNPLFQLSSSFWNSSLGAVRATASLQVTSYQRNTNPTISKLSFLVGTDNAAATEQMFITSAGLFGTNGGANFLGGTGSYLNDVTLLQTAAATSSVAISSNRLVLKGNAWNSVQGSRPSMGYLQMINVTNNANPTTDKLSFFVGSADNNNVNNVIGNSTERLAIRTDGIFSYFNLAGTEFLRLVGSTGNIIMQNGGTFTDAGYRLDVNGTTRLNGQTTLTGSVTASSALAQGIIASPTLVAAANSDVLVALDINPTFTNGAFTGLQNYGLRTSGYIRSANFNTQIAGITTYSSLCNIGFGVGALQTGGNICIGGLNTGSNRTTAQSITSGYANITLGWGTASYISTGLGNIALGDRALDGNSTTQSNNIAIGRQSLFVNTGDSNIAIGYRCAENVTSGGSNVFLGISAGRLQADGSTGLALTGNNNIYIGQAARGFDNSDTNTIVIGSVGISLGSNTTVIGNSSTTITGLFGNIRLASGMATAPASATATGTTGDIRVTAGAIYVCTATNTWVRALLTTF